MAISVCYHWANKVNEKKTALMYMHSTYSPTVRNAKINLQNNTHNINSTTHPNLSFYLRETYRICNFIANCCDYARKQYKAPISFSPEVYETSSKTGSRIRIFYLLTGPIGAYQVCRYTVATVRLIRWPCAHLHIYRHNCAIWRPVLFHIGV